MAGHVMKAIMSRAPNKEVTKVMPQLRPLALRYMLKDWALYKLPSMLMTTALVVASIQAGGFYQGTVYPPQYQGALFFSDYNGDWIYVTLEHQWYRYKFDFGTDVSPVGGIVQLLDWSGYESLLRGLQSDQHQTPAKSAAFVIPPGEILLPLPMPAPTPTLVMCH